MLMMVSQLKVRVKAKANKVVVPMVSTKMKGKTMMNHLLWWMTKRSMYPVEVRVLAVVLAAGAGDDRPNAVHGLWGAEGVVAQVEDARVSHPKVALTRRL